jgi:rSAM/selenodomain-associated transferase 1
MNVALAIMVKQPAPGRVKTRLCPPLTPEQATDLYRCFLLDKMAQVRRIAAATPYLAFTPREAESYFRDLAGETFSQVPQEGNDLGERLNHLSTHLLVAGHPGVVVIDSDTPSLPDRFLAEAVERMADPHADAVFGPAEDGGYYLVGLRRSAPALFQGITWSTPVVLEQTLRAAAGTGLRVHLLPPWYDVDTGKDLGRLTRDLEGNGTMARHTWAFLQAVRAGWLEGHPS